MSSLDWGEAWVRVLCAFFGDESEAVFWRLLGEDLFGWGGDRLVLSFSGVLDRRTVRDSEFSWRFRVETQSVELCVRCIL